MQASQQVGEEHAEGGAIDGSRETRKDLPSDGEENGLSSRRRSNWLLACAFRDSLLGLSDLAQEVIEFISRNLKGVIVIRNGGISDGCFCLLLYCASLLVGMTRAIDVGDHIECTVIRDLLA